MNNVRRVIVILMGSSLILGSGIGMAAAQDATATPTTPTTQGSTDVTRTRGDRLGEVGDVLRDVVQMLRANGLTASDYRQMIDDGMTPEDVLSSYGIDPDELRDDLIFALEMRLDRAVGNGSITEAQRDERLSQFDTIYDEFLAGEYRLNLPRNQEDTVAGVRADLIRVLRETGLTAAEVSQMLQAGSTPQDILVGAGVDIVQLEADLRTALADRLQTAVDNGNLTEAQVENRLETFDASFDALLDGELRDQIRERRDNLPNDGNGPRGNRPNRRNNDN